MENFSFPSPGADRARSVVVGSDDLRHQLVSNDVLVGKHNASDPVHVGEKPNPFIDPLGYKAYVDNSEKSFLSKLEEQKRGR